jgi:hypothetical protein
MTREQIRASISDQTALIATLLGECANEPIEGQAAVACAIRNRVRNPRWWGKGWRGVCLKHVIRNGKPIGQFTCWWQENANTTRVYALAEALLHRRDATGPLSVVGQLHWIAAGVMDDMLIDNSGGADHYLTRRLFNSPKCPVWAKGQRPVAERAAHVFLRLEI